VQVNEIDLKGLKLNRVKVIDRSFLFEDYRDKRYKGTTLKIKTEHNLKSMKEITISEPKRDNNTALSPGE
jgi:radical SAM superfamily enzyme